MLEARTGAPGREPKVAVRRLRRIPPSADAITFAAFATTYLARVSKVRARNKGWVNDQHMFAQLAAFLLPTGGTLGAKALAAITEDDLEAFVLALRAKGRATSTRNHYVGLLKAAFRWAVTKGFTSYRSARPPSAGWALQR